MKKLRLILWKNCTRNCAGCVNNDWDIDNLPFPTTFKGYDQIILTGGEPLLYPDKLQEILVDIKSQTDVPVYLYTALPNHNLLNLLPLLDGITVTLHEPKDRIMFKAFLSCLKPQTKSLYLNVFKGIDISDINLEGWKVKLNIDWIKNCPLPEGEVLMQYYNEENK